MSGRVSEPVHLTADEGQRLMAVAYKDGSVVLHRGDVRKERGSKSKVLVEGGRGDAVSGMAFRNTSKATLLYVATESSVRCFCVSDKTETAVTLDSVGCGPGTVL